MKLDDLKDKLLDQWGDLSSQIVESSAFNSLREQYESQSPIVQKAILWGAAAFFVLVMAMIPQSYLSTSNEYLDQFEENRHLIQGLLRASKAKNEPSPLPQEMTTEAIKAKVEDAIKTTRIVPDQIGESVALPASATKGLVPAGIGQNGVAIHLKQLNLDQVVEVSLRLQNLGPGYKLIGIDMVQTAGQTHYYNLNARVAYFFLHALNTTTSDDKDDLPKSPPARRGNSEDGGE